MDKPTQFEIDDSLGQTEAYSGTVGTSPTAVPTVAGPIISEAMVMCTELEKNNKSMDVSFDGQNTWYPLGAQESVVTEVRGSRTQIHIKGSAANVGYKIILLVEQA